MDAELRKETRAMSFPSLPLIVSRPSSREKNHVNVSNFETTTKRFFLLFSSSIDGPGSRLSQAVSLFGARRSVNFPLGKATSREEEEEAKVFQSGSVGRENGKTGSMTLKVQTERTE